MPDIVLLTESRYLTAKPGDWYTAQILQDDALLASALRDIGLSSERMDWADPAFFHTVATAAVFRTTWDYFHRFREFSEWLSRAERHLPLINPPATVRWNWDKHYLLDLARQGVPIPETKAVEAGGLRTLRESLEGVNGDEFIIKPAVSGTARHTYRINPGTIDAHEGIFQTLTRSEAMLIQPFQQSILHQGEKSLVIIDGKYSHAVLKRAKPGDFRVQDDFGGTAVPADATSEEIRLAEMAVASCPALPAYARADIIMGNNGHLCVMELELIEPELWLRHRPEAAKALAKAISDRLG